VNRPPGPARRYASADQLADDLRRILGGAPIQARPVGRAERLWRWCRRYPLVAALGTAFVLSLVVGFALTTWKWWASGLCLPSPSLRGAVPVAPTACG
jgi:hypothetical protein